MGKARDAAGRLRTLLREENREALLLFLRECGRLLRHARFRELSGTAELGMEDPYRMGQLLSLCSILFPFYGEQLTITPYFDRNELSGRVRARGRLRLIHLLLALFRLLRNREIRALLFPGDAEGRSAERRAARKRKSTEKEELDGREQ